MIFVQATRYSAKGFKEQPTLKPSVRRKISWGALVEYSISLTFDGCKERETRGHRESLRSREEKRSLALRRALYVMNWSFSQVLP
jgi:hypothetical protein